MLGCRCWSAHFDAAVAGRAQRRRCWSRLSTLKAPVNPQPQGSGTVRGTRQSFFGAFGVCASLTHFDVHGLLQRLIAASAASWPSAAEPAPQRWPVCSSARISCTGARRSRTKTAAGGPDHRSMPPAYRQACSHDQHRRLQRNPAGQRVTSDHCGPCRFALPAATRTKCACPSSWLKVVRRSNRLHGLMSGRRARCGRVRPAD